MVLITDKVFKYINFVEIFFILINIFGFEDIFDIDVKYLNMLLREVNENLFC